MNNKKTYIIFLIILTIYLGIVFVLYKTDALGPKTSYIVFNDGSVLTIEKNKYKIDTENEEVLKNKKLKVYDYNEYLGEYNVKFSENTYKVYDDKYNLIRFQNSFIATYSKKDTIKMNTSKFESLNAKDLEMLKEIINKENIQTYSYLPIEQKRQINVEDGKQTYIYSISNQSIVNNDEKFFSIVFTATDGEYQIIKKDVANKEEYNRLVSYNIEALIDVDNDNTDEIVINTQIFSQNGEPTRELYKLKNNKYEIVELQKSK